MAFAAAALAPKGAPAQQPQDPGYGPHMWDYGWHGWFLGSLMMLLSLAVIVAVVVLLLRWLGGPGHGEPGHGRHQPPANGQSPIDILKERFARGEIDKEEFEERRRVLGE
jgi:putative membrane protein